MKISRIVEIEVPTAAGFLYDQATAEALDAIEWLRPHFLDDDGMLLMSIHALVVECGGRGGQKILVDTCVGNDKPRTIPDWNMRQGSFLEDLAAAGHPRESIDTVLCTHLHVDHAGWNTMWRGDRWVPTFPNARYLFAKREWEYWSEAPEDQFGPVVQDSVRPIVDAGLADLVESDTRITDEVWLEPTPGHTPGHVSVRISSQSEEAVITGDMTHHPCQFAHPEWSTTVDYDREASCVTRQAFCERYADSGVLVIGTHFPTTTAGHLVRDGEAYRLSTR